MRSHDLNRLLDEPGSERRPSRTENMYLGSAPVWSFTGRMWATPPASCLPLRQPMPVLFVGRSMLLRIVQIQGKPAPQLAGADSRYLPKGVALTWSMRPLGGNWRWHAP